MLDRLLGSFYMPHGYCLLWDPWLVAVHAGSDFAIFAAYFAIPIAMWSFVRQRPNIELRRMAMLFAAFIFWCGFTHLFSIVTLWWPAYELQGIVKAVTATISVMTAVMIFPLIPKALAIPSPNELQIANRSLQEEIAAHRRTLEELQLARQFLEQRVQERTADLEAANERVQRSTQILQAISELSPELIFAKDRKRRLLFVSKSLTVLLQQSVEDLIGKDEREFLSNPDDIKQIQDNDARVLNGETITIEEPVTTPDGRKVVFLSNKLPWRDENGEVIGILGIAVDITERRLHEERMLLVMREVNHRAKNMLAVVQAIAHSSSRFANSVQEYVESFGARLRSLAAAMDLLVYNEWRGVDLEELVRSQIRHLDDQLGSRIRTQGTPLLVNGTAAQTLGMALHELATNAAKYGALSNERGYVTVTWSCDGSAFLLTWAEANGPVVRPPRRKGFGWSVIDSLVRANFGCAPAMSFEPSGFIWRFSAQRTDIEQHVDRPVPQASSKAGDTTGMLEPSLDG